MLNFWQRRVVGNGLLGYNYDNQQSMRGVRMTGSGVSSGLEEQVARVVRRMTVTQRARLLELAPQLRRDVAVSAESVVDYFERRMSEVLPDVSSDDSAPFLGECTLEQFCRLPEDEQVRLWDQAHAQAEKELGDNEYPVRPDAVLAR